MIATDLDGALLRNDSTMSNYTKSVLEKCRSKGIKIVPATARSSIMVILHKEAMKSKGLVALADYWGIRSCKIVAFGDDTIDIDLLEYCDVGVAVSNALDEVKAVADYVCGGNDDEGVAKWLEMQKATEVN